MKRFLIAVFAMVLLMFSCKGNKTAKDADEVVPDSSDSFVVDTVPVDTMEQLISETPMPKAADELFDDFFFNFAANRKLQMGRIKFPLPVIKGDQTDYIQKEDWRMDHFFMRQGYYTLIFDNMKQMAVVKDTSIDHVVVEKVFFPKKQVKQYVFDRVGGLWMLCSIHYKPLYENTNASFLKFYQRFSRDSAFQIASLKDPVKFTGPDPDDDFSQIEGVITADTWPAFASEMPSKMIYNIIYGQTYTESDHKIFVIRGISNGLEVEMTFERKGGKWLLVELST
ncbi:DUF4348 domain-containing protein [Marseilla massiliensis]|jgi:hypothetical protein|uniref:DUF4348 domain-containing protein n=1 Tax=Marseilla massiliensis TaxID=1841864 RepID=A0A938WMW8_9BACT|nr:DUF4348 domain-containing protein [Marseilla massiliensis]